MRTFVQQDTNNLYVTVFHSFKERSSASGIWGERDKRVRMQTVEQDAD